MSTDAHFKKWLKATFTPLETNLWVRGQTQQQYFDAPGVNASTIKYDTPEEMRFWAERGDENPYLSGSEDQAYNFALGEALHKAVLEPDMFDTVDGIEEYFQYAPEGPRGGEGLTNKNAVRAYEADPSRPLVTGAIIEKAKRMRDAIFRSQQAGELLRVPADRELSGYAWDEELECILKGRVDFLPRGGDYIVDIKTARSLKQRDYQRALWDLGYHLSAALYLDVVAAIEGRIRQRFLHIAVTGPKARNESPTAAPYQCLVFDISEHLAEGRNGLSGYRAKLHKFCHAAKNWDWEGYEHAEIVQLTPDRRM